MHTQSARRLGFPALVTGATGIAFAPIWVRLSEVGPSATAFHRLLFALPVLWLWLGWESGGPRQSRAPARWGEYWLLGAAGLFFAGDLAVWHWSIKLTAVANATLFANFAPILVTLGARFFLHERITPVFVAGMVLALLGGALVAGISFSKTWRHVLGDALGLTTAFFYAAYLLSVKQLRRTFSAATIMAWSGLATCPALAAVTWASGEGFLAQTPKGWLVLVTLALTSQVAGQGLIAYAAAHMSASFLSVSLLLQPAVAAVLAWLLLAEPMSAWQMVGGGVILAGIAMAGSTSHSRRRN